MKSHTGGVMSFGLGGFVCKSSKQKLNTKSSTEAELVGASDYLPNTIWMQNFLRAQGYSMEESIFMQDNESAMKLETNGRMSAGQKSRHIEIRYFWIKDRTEANGIKINHCPTLSMLADFFTKPLQGHLFRRFRDVYGPLPYQYAPEHHRATVRGACWRTTNWCTRYRADRTVHNETSKEDDGRTGHK